MQMGFPIPETHTGDPDKWQEAKNNTHNVCVQDTDLEASVTHCCYHRL